MSDRDPLSTIRTGETIAVTLHPGAHDTFGPNAAASVVGQQFPVTDNGGDRYSGTAMACTLAPEGHLVVTVKIGERLP